MSCNHAAGGCNYPEGECAGVCQSMAAGTVAERLERAHRGKTIKEIWPSGHGLEIVFTDDSSLIFMAPFAFKPAPTAKPGGVK